MRKIYKKKQKYIFDKPLLVISLILLAIGLVAVADASAPYAAKEFGDEFYFVKQQTLWAIVGIVSMFVFSRLNYKLWEKIATPIFLVNILLLILLLIPSVGSQFLGARRWILLGPISIQPSEFIKLSLAIFLAKVVVKKNQVKSYFIPIIITSGLVMLQPDLGTTLVIVAMGMTQLFVSGVNLFHFIIALSAGLLGSFVLIITSSYRRDRLLTFLDQTRDPLGKSYHLRQVLLALGTGGLMGVGLGQSRQKYLFLPETATDSIFAIIAEEVGFIGATILVFIFIAFIFRCLKISASAPDKFSQILSVGITAWIGSQILLNIGSMVSAVPLTGLPLPFISYGGSALVMVLSAVGILLNISKYAKEKT
ncbi:cell division protein FtsW [Candidatus Woesebacteria bacterium RIFCSPLOWO2_01_FULL_37_19]|uniref:Probable peptidoglycan glycosyltransferase FtsW n=2 Tax=Candidatus Woeseibacteriota TaxID=1752722 RepID=A0A1F8B0Y9_9BACT|nr:MAG: cell division protein FtsW [Candidatus Woesebacteria bacterium RIFCSPHIGHO2_01_FULL_38_26b]OGM57145.1 MAG: cell division protein FtsW [Candidatus Woesebacteria bacterium RIFCSPLOWO2_01_FULL_37_19]